MVQELLTVEQKIELTQSPIVIEYLQRMNKDEPATSTESATQSDNEDFS